MTPVTFTRAGFKAGLAAAPPLALSAGVYGLAFGVLAKQAGLDLPTAVLMSALVNSGTAQLVALQIWGTPLPVVAMTVAVLALNARYILMSAALRPWLEPIKRRHAYSMLFLLGDGSWAVAMREYARGMRDVGFFLGASVSMYPMWVGGTGIGHAAGSLLGEPRALGVDFLLTAFCTTLAMVFWRGRSDLAPVIVAASTATAVSFWLPGSWYVLAGGLAGSLTAACRHQDTPDADRA